MKKSLQKREKILLPSDIESFLTSVGYHYVWFVLLDLVSSFRHQFNSFQPFLKRMKDEDLNENFNYFQIASNILQLRRKTFA